MRRFAAGRGDNGVCGREHLVSTARLGPQRGQLGDDTAAELVARLRERERGVGVQALEAAGARRATDACVELRPQRPLLRLCHLEACRQVWVVDRGATPSLDTARGLEP